MESVQEEQLERVEQNIAGLVMDFVKERYLTEPQFYIGDLIDFVTIEVESAPTSPDRMLRKLRKDGRCNYRVVSRRKSFYEITSI